MQKNVNSFINNKLTFLNIQVDLYIIFIMLIIGGGVAYFNALTLDPVLFQNASSSAWFEADIPRISANMSDRASDHYRTKVHPIFSLISFPPVYFLNKLLGIEQLTSIRLVISVIAAFWLGVLYITLRAIGCYRIDSILFSILGMVSATSMFWFSVPETFPFGSLSILLVLLFVAMTQNKQFSTSWYVAISALSLSFTTTNWMVGILAVFVNHNFKKFIKITFYAFILMLFLWGIQRLLFPSAKLFLFVMGESKYIATPESGGVIPIAISFFYHTIVMPAFDIVERVTHPDWPMLVTQTATAGSGSSWGKYAVVIWSCLLLLGTWALLSLKNNSKFRFVLGLSLLGQLSLHLLYGTETFLYSLHFLPILILFAALSTQTKFRYIVLFITTLLIVFAGLNNRVQFLEAADFLKEYGSPRHQVKLQMLARASDPWPRSEGHSILAIPQSENKAYHEPGGNFSPAVKSFGLSIWLKDTQNKFIAGSETIPVDTIKQRLIHGHLEPPQIETQTDYYNTIWGISSHNTWQLNLEPKTSNRLQLVIRSVGPAGGPIYSLSRKNNKLIINSKWSISFSSPPKNIVFGEEGEKGWMDKVSSKNNWQSKKGWGYAIIELNPSQTIELTITDLSQPNKAIDKNSTHSIIEINLPDSRFNDSLQAQIAHLKMGLVNNETRPGDPTHYPLAWQRDGAYVVVALARAGEVELAKKLLKQFAEKDFFGGFGSEGDAPGLSLWVLNEVSMILKDKAYDEWLWTHVKRKVQIIEEMLATKNRIYKAVTPPIVPLVMTKTKYYHEPDGQIHSELEVIAKASRNGLIVGRMDNQWPILHINAMSYAGLISAAAIAKRINKVKESQHLTALAKKLQKAWKKAFVLPEISNTRTYISAIWPTWVSDKKDQKLVHKIKNRISKKLNENGAFYVKPQWTYFELAEAHQWLFLDDINNVWAVLDWFWENQSSPGLYTWWEGGTEETNTFYKWDQVRGWVNPPHVTPHYWTAAEMLLLQLDMLAYVDQSNADSLLVIGAGVKTEWLESPMSVKRMNIAGRIIDWKWDFSKKEMNIVIKGKKLDIELGKNFPLKSKTNIVYK